MSAEDDGEEWAQRFFPTLRIRARRWWFVALTVEPNGEWFTWTLRYASIEANTFKPRVSGYVSAQPDTMQRSYRTAAEAREAAGAWLQRELMRESGLFVEGSP